MCLNLCIKQDLKLLLKSIAWEIVFHKKNVNDLAEFITLSIIIYQVVSYDKNYINNCDLKHYLS